jgi:chromate reductase
MQMPEAHVGGIENKFDAKGVLSDNSTRDFLQNFMTDYAEWVERNANACQAATA